MKEVIFISLLDYRRQRVPTWITAIDDECIMYEIEKPLKWKKAIRDQKMLYYCFKYFISTIFIFSVYPGRCLSVDI